MTAWRVGVAIKPEATFGVENPDTNVKWHYVGIGMDFNITENNGWRFQNGMGSKIPELEFEGRFSATWGCNLYLDYNNFYWLAFGLEGYAFTTDAIGESEESRGIHIFTTKNSKAIKSFSILIEKLDREVGGDFDERIVLLGCVMNKINPNYESSSSAVKCSIGGPFVDTVLTATTLEDCEAYDSTTKNTPRPFEWGCLQVLNEKETGWEKIANNEKTSYSITRTVNTIPECGERIDTGFYESPIASIPLTSTVYSRNPNQWQTRMHTGGIRNDIALNGTSSPRKKGLEPIPNIRIASSSDNNRYVTYAEFEEVVVDSWGNSYSSNTEITESPSLKARKGRIVIKTPDVTSAIIDPTLTAVKVVFDFNDDAISDLVGYYTVGDVIELPKPKKANSEFVKWTQGNNDYLGHQKVTLLSSMASNNAITFNAVWSE